MLGFRFHKFLKNEEEEPFDKFFKLFREILIHTSGDLAEALEWMTQIDRDHHLSNSNYGMGNFIEDLKQKGFLKEDYQEGTITISSKMEQSIRQSALDQIFGKIKKSNKGDNASNLTGNGDEISPEQRAFQFGDEIHQIALTDSLKNAFGILSGSAEVFKEEDLVVNERELKAQSSTV